MTSESTAPVAIVTAGSKRLGRALAIKLAEMGYDIALHYNTSEDDAKTTAHQVRGKGRQCELFRRNFRNFDEVLTLIPEIMQRYGRPPEVLVNNASVFDRNILRETTPEEFDADFAVHVKAPYFLMRDFAKNCQRGHIINMVDAAVVKTGTTYFTYLLSKKTLYELTRMAAKELAPRIRVNAIAPGIILQPIGWEKNKADKAARENLLQRPAGPPDVVHALEYLLKSEQVTGDCLFVDGGDHVDL
jgi:pteridine reductase